jgi:hypothetical protein
MGVQRRWRTQELGSAAKCSCRSAPTARGDGSTQTWGNILRLFRLFQDRLSTGTPMDPLTTTLPLEQRVTEGPDCLCFCCTDKDGEATNRFWPSGIRKPSPGLESSKPRQVGSAQTTLDAPPTHRLLLESSRSLSAVSDRTLSRVHPTLLHRRHRPLRPPQVPPGGECSPPTPLQLRPPQGPLAAQWRL